MIISKIAISGGPCAGKTSALEFIRRHFTLKGYNVVIINETATEIINSGITPSLAGQIPFQRMLLKLQLSKEKIFTDAAEALDNNTIIICDRGALDGKAYLQDDEFDKLLSEAGITEDKLLSLYNAVIFLDSTANSDNDIYTISNNCARTENASEAAELNKRTLRIWQKHKNFILIQNENEFSEKLNNIINQIEKILSETEIL